MSSPRKQFRAILTVLALVISLPWISLHAEEEQEASAAASTPASLETGGLIDFVRDVQPIFASKCLRCHGPEEAKNDFRIDESESVLSYAEPGDASASSLWIDYLVTEDEEMRMPPSSEVAEENLTGSELATIKLWIEEGARWPAESDSVGDASHDVPAASASLLSRIWQFQGVFHPATIHFPIALLSVSAGFVLLSFFRSETCEPVAYHCLWIGALGAIVAVVTGWSYAQQEGYGQSFTFDLRESAIDRHRWLGVAVAVLAVIMIPMASYVRRTQDMGMRFMWLLGSVLLLGAVGTVGYQGGELTYGEGHYDQEFQRLFPEAAKGLPWGESDANLAEPSGSDELAPSDTEGELERGEASVESEEAREATSDVPSDGAPAEDHSTSDVPD